MKYLSVIWLLDLRIALVAIFVLTIGVSPIRADEGTDAKDVTTAYLKLTDRGDAEGAYRMIGETWKGMQPKQEIMAGLLRWFEAKGGSAPSHAIVAQRIISQDEARAMAPGSNVKGNVYLFRYRSKYPNGVFFEDLYIGRDSDDVLRVSGHRPQPAE